MRKIIQIAFNPCSSEGNYDGDMYALCDDGTIWSWDRRKGWAKWGDSSEIPQIDPLPVVSEGETEVMDNPLYKAKGKATDVNEG